MNTCEETFFMNVLNSSFSSVSGVTSSAKSDERDLKNNDAVSNLEQAWEEMLVKAPEVIALLGQITVLSGSADFSLTNNTPVNGFQYMRHPQSFRATLTQVSNDGWSAFRLTHRNMKIIQGNMQTIPEQIKLLLQIIVQSPIKLVRKLATTSVTNIKDRGQSGLSILEPSERQAAVTALLESSKESAAQIRKMTRTRREQYNATVNAVSAEETKSLRNLKVESAW
jgi:hypothetical protein